MSHWFDALKEHGIRSPFDLTEFDQWSNDAQREDINALLKERGEDGVFGLKVNGKLEWIPGSKLRDVLNFGVDYIFAEDDYHDVELAVHKFKDTDYNRFLSELSNFSIYDCLWV